MSTARKTIMAIHGAGMTGGAWGGIVPHLLDHSFRASTLPGHDPKAGGSLLPDIAGMAGYVRDRLTGMPEASVVLAGHSMGGLVALSASSHPAVAALVLMGCAAQMPVNADLLKTAQEKPAEAIGLLIKWGVWPGHQQVGAVRTVLGSVMNGADPRAVYNDLKACDDFKEGEQLAMSCDKPALVISAEHDKLTRPAEVEKLAGVFRGGTYTLLKDCGHMMMIERPIETAQAIKIFLATNSMTIVAKGGAAGG
jgi:pimeloyl-ACP methyl ester carboxylesterase